MTRDLLRSAAWFVLVLVLAHGAVNAEETETVAPEPEDPVLEGEAKKAHEK